MFPSGNKKPSFGKRYRKVATLNWLDGIFLLIAGLAVGVLLHVVGSPVSKFWTSFGKRTQRVGFIGLIILAVAAFSVANLPDSNDSPGHLKVCAEDIGGIPAQPATVVLYTNDWEYIEPKTTDLSGCTDIWFNLVPSSYNISLYGEGTDGPYWGSARAIVIPGNLETSTVKRTMPYLLSSSPLPPRIADSGQIQIGVEIASKEATAWNVELHIIVDRDQKKPWDQVLIKSAHVKGNSSVWITTTASGLAPGNYSMSYDLKALLPWSKKWVVTDHTGWQSGLDVQHKGG